MPVPLQWLLVVLVASVMAAPPTAQAATGTYVDDDRSRFEGFIETASRAGLVSGCNPPANDRFCPHRVVTRGEMALMLDRILELPPPKRDHFEDDDGLLAERAINSLAQAGVTSGCRSGAFCPDRPLTRGEMAALITDTLAWELRPVDPYRYIDLLESPHGRALATLASRDGLDPCDPPEGRRLCPGATVSRDEAVFALAKSLSLDPVPAGGRRAGMKVGFHDGFEKLGLWDGRSPGSRNRVRLTEAGFRGSGLKVGVPRGSHFGADFKLDLSDVVGEEPETLFFRYYLRFDAGWKPQASGKLPGFSGVYGHTGKGGYRSSPSAPGWSARMKFSGSRPDDPRARLGFYVYHLGQERRYGDGMDWNEAGKLQPGQWYCVEGQVELNTPGLADGALRAWVDGTPAFDQAGIEFRRPSEPEIKVESFWFNVYYGGKPVSPADMGLTVDEVAVDGSRIGCDAGPGLARAVEGDLSGNGYPDQLWWGRCAAGPCFVARETGEAGHAPVAPLAEGAWFSLATHELGIVTLDIDGDSDDDILYRGRCGRSRPCWRAHRVEGGKATPGLDWGDGARFSPQTRSLVTGDFDGNGIDDLAYVGLCGSGNTAHRCWRTHLGRKKAGFAAPLDWGVPASDLATAPQAADLTGDGRDDILYAGPCPKGTCWYLAESGAGGFAKAVNMGRARRPELERRRLFDFDGDRRADLVTVRASDNGSVVEWRPAGKGGFGDPRRLIAMRREIADVSLRRGPGTSRPVEGLAVTACEDPQGCVVPLVRLSDRLVGEPQYERALMVRLIRALGAEPAPRELAYR